MSSFYGSLIEGLHCIDPFNYWLFGLSVSVEVPSLCVPGRMREQVKGRMEQLLEQEIQSRQQLSTSTNHSPKPVSRTGQTSLTASTTSRAATGCEESDTQSDSEAGSRESAKADLVFNVDSGECVCVAMYSD